MEAKEKQSIDPRMIKLVRERTGLSQSQIGSVLGCHQTDISRIERGVETPDWLIKFAALSRLLIDAGMSWDDVVMNFSDSQKVKEAPGEYNTSS